MPVPPSSTDRAACQPVLDSRPMGLSRQDQTQTRRRRGCRRRAWVDNTPLGLACTSTPTRCPDMIPACRSSLEWATPAPHRECPLQPVFCWRALWHPRRCSQSPAPIATALLERIPVGRRVQSPSPSIHRCTGSGRSWTEWRDVPVGTGIAPLPRSCS